MTLLQLDAGRYPGMVGRPQAGRCATVLRNRGEEWPAWAIWAELASKFGLDGEGAVA